VHVPNGLRNLDHGYSAEVTSRIPSILGLFLGNQPPSPWHHCRENAQVAQGGRHLLGGPQACIPDIHCDKSIGRREVRCRALGELGLHGVPDVAHPLIISVQHAGSRHRGPESVNVHYAVAVSQMVAPHLVGHH
jgi:hypothetical protein